MYSATNYLPTSEIFSFTRENHMKVLLNMASLDGNTQTKKNTISLEIQSKHYLELVFCDLLGQCW